MASPSPPRETPSERAMTKHAPNEQTMLEGTLEETLEETLDVQALAEDARMVEDAPVGMLSTREITDGIDALVERAVESKRRRGGMRVPRGSGCGACGVVNRNVDPSVMRRAKAAAKKTSRSLGFVSSGFR